MSGNLVVAVGSTNPTKVGAVRHVFQRVWKSAAVRGVEVDPEVPPQPIGSRVIVWGAVKRAKAALQKLNADFGVGIEGGVAKFGSRWYNLGFVAVVHRSGEIGMGTSGWFECPGGILKELQKGKELGDVMDEMMGRRGTKMDVGVIGIFTRGHVDRTGLYEHGVWMALCRFLSPEFFGSRGSIHG